MTGVPPVRPLGGEHAPVLRDAAIESLAIRPDGCYVDATFGRGGHAGEILGRLGDEGTLVAIDRDPESAAAAAILFSGDRRALFFRSRFSELLQHVEPASADGVLFDLGVSSPQLDEARRGFSFMRDGPLDMRMDPDSGISAAAFLAGSDEREIATVIARLGEERHARRIARAIVAARASGAIETTSRLAGVVAAAVPGREPGRHPATRSFQALRFHVNDELGQLRSALSGALELLSVGGRLAVISFHSLEDRIAKQFNQTHSTEDPIFAGLPVIPDAMQPRLARVGSKVRPTDAEVAANPRSRSSVLRIARKVR